MFGSVGSRVVEVARLPLLELVLQRWKNHFDHSLHIAGRPVCLLVNVIKLLLDVVLMAVQILFELVSSGENVGHLHITFGVCACFCLVHQLGHFNPFDCESLLKLLYESEHRAHSFLVPFHISLEGLSLGEMRWAEQMRMTTILPPCIPVHVSPTAEATYLARQHIGFDLLVSVHATPRVVLLALPCPFPVDFTSCLLSPAQSLQNSRATIIATVAHCSEGVLKDNSRKLLSLLLHKGSVETFAMAQRSELIA